MPKLPQIAVIACGGFLKLNVIMWKALIKLVEKWGYRCDHKWQLINQSNILDREMYQKGIEINVRIEYTYVCEKCLLSKKVI